MTRVFNISRSPSVEPALPIRSSLFREGLYYRLNMFPVFLPPLRERKNEDIPEFVRYFVQQFADSMDKTVETIPEETMRSIVRHSWPGNIRELQNYVARGVILFHGRSILHPKRANHHGPRF